MTPSELRAKHEEAHPKSYYFSRRTMKFFGDSMRNYGVRTYRDNPDYWELWRKHPVNGHLQSSHFFHKQTMEEMTQPREGTS